MKGGTGYKTADVNVLTGCTHGDGVEVEEEVKAML